MGSQVGVSGSPIGQLFSGSSVIDITEKLLNILGKNGNYQYFWQNPKTETIWFKGKPPQIPTSWKNVYFGVNPSKNKFTGAARGTIENIAGINCLYGEFDEKDGWTLEKIEKIEPSPSINISSGGGWHCYWLLRETEKVTKENITYLSNLQKKWVDFIGSDKNAKDLTRMLRVPYSMNHKYNPPRIVQFVKVDFGIMYDLSELEEIISKETKIQGLKEKNDEALYSQVIIALAKLNRERCENRNDWINVGIALYRGFNGSQVGLAQWDTWSRSSQKYKDGECFIKWNGFGTERDKEITIKSLFWWADQDSKGLYIQKAPKRAKPSHYLNALQTMGYSFTMNRMNDRLYVNGNLISDGLVSSLMTKLRELEYSSKPVFFDVVIAEGYKNQFHPIEEYLNSLSWDGEDHIGNLSRYFKDKDGVFPLLIRKWLIGAVSRILEPSPAQQNPMLVFDGKQGCGKSIFVNWLGSVLPELFISSPIYPDNKDFVINSASHFVWEVEELGSTIRKADREALKAFITRPEVSFRPPYGKFEIKKLVTCSYIGTINDEGGFLNDPTGNRRFRVCGLTSINWDYSTNIDVNQVWANAVGLFHKGDTYKLDKSEENIIDGINNRFEIDDPLANFLMENFIIDKDNPNLFCTTNEIISTLKKCGVQIDVIDRGVSMRISAILTKMDLEKKQKRIGTGNAVRGWVGIASKDKNIIDEVFPD